MKFYFSLFILFFCNTIFFAQRVSSVKEQRVGEWEIKNGIFIDKKHDKNSLAAYNWRVFYNSFPRKITQRYIKKLVLIHDGLDEKTGALGALTEDNDQWQLVIDTVDVDFKSKSKERLYQSIYTLIHEFGHLITLNNTQIKPIVSKKIKNGVVKQSETDSYLTIEGEAFKNSYMNLFVRRFWSGGLLNEWDFIQKKYCFVEQKSCLDKLRGLYQENHNDFVTDYAAESPEEDIAESWTYFVLEDEKVKNPEMVAHQKINFFYQFPELVLYRKIIRRNIKKYIKP